MHDNSTNNSRITCTSAGTYLITGVVSWDTNLNGLRTASIKLNGTTLLDAFLLTSMAGGNGGMAPVTLLYPLIVGDYVELMAYTSVTASTEIAYTRFSAVRQADTGYTGPTGVTGPSVSGSNGAFTKNISDADAATTVIAHGLGTAPTKVRLSSSHGLQQAGDFSFGTYDASGQHYIVSHFDADSGANTNGTGAICLMEDGSRYQVGTVTVDATNITITWAKTGTITSITMNVLWEALK
jgi:hypothetical protein